MTGHPCLSQHCIRREKDEAQHREGVAVSKWAERLNENSQRVRENEKRVAAQLAFVERLQASGRNTRSAEEALEVMRRLLSDLYQTRILLRQQAISPDRRTPVGPTPKGKRPARPKARRKASR
jgi:hypothetical protein